MLPIPRIHILRVQARYGVTQQLPRLLHPQGFRLNSTFSTPPQNKPELTEKKTWLASKIATSPTTRKLFFAVASMMGYTSSKQLAGRRAFNLYKDLCAEQPDRDREFWQEGCSMPATFQTWFTVTNLHLWMLSVRLRALPDPIGKYYIQSLIDHFFIDIEDRIRDIYQPLPLDQLATKQHYTSRSDFYVNPNERLEVEVKGKMMRVRAPDRIIRQQMSVFKEQWAGLGMSMDLALVQGDQEMAAAIWRNILGARGAKGIAYPSSSPDATPKFRRQVNTALSKTAKDVEETKDDGSGVHDFPPEDVDKYLQYPELMLDIVGYVRSNLVRLENIPNSDIVNGDLEKLRFQKIKHIL